MGNTVTTKGQVTIPKQVRDLLGIKPGSSVAFEVAEDGRVLFAGEDVAGLKPARLRRRVGYVFQGVGLA